MAGGYSLPSGYPNIFGHIEFCKVEKDLAKYLGLEHDKCADAYIRTPIRAVLLEKKSTDLKMGIRQLEITYKALIKNGDNVNEIILKLERIKPPLNKNYKFEGLKEYFNRRVLWTKLSGKWQIFKEIGNLPIFNDYQPPLK